MLLITTTDTVSGYRIVESLGLVSGEAVEGMNPMHDLFAQFRTMFGGRTAGYEKAISAARARALQLLSERALSAGATAVIGVSINYAFIELGSKGGSVMVSATGTAVKVVRAEQLPKTPDSTFRIGG